VAEFDILFNEGISRTGTAIDLGVDLNIIDKKGAWFSYKGDRLGQGREAVREELKKKPSLLEEIEAQIMQKCRDGSAISKVVEEAAEVDLALA
jgi:recombination protein RecA